MTTKDTWLLFSINSYKYALPSSSVQEIAQNEKVYRLPLVPPFISGLINYRGAPCTVIDPAILFEEKNQESYLFLVINSNDKNCLRISTVHKFVSGIIESIQEPTNSIKSHYYKGYLLIDTEKIPVLDADSFIEKTRRTLENS
ncbi:MAG TPA: chemotaxis protein CheW [Treponemataceae bacterium]|nr:chemotaxis protein CheW [Treponemataceae bacterium]